jgi:hypothetical protein
MRLVGVPALVLLASACSTHGGENVSDGSALAADARMPTIDARAPGHDASTDVTARDASRPGDASQREASPSDAGAGDAPLYRNPLTQPFASSSIWNMPLGSGATFVAATLVPVTGTALEGDQDIIVLTPTAPSTDIYNNTADWQPTVSRCPWDAGALLFSAPIPSSFVFGDTPISSTPNAGLAVLLADQRTIRQTQPFARCTAGEPGTSNVMSPNVDLYGDGIPGAHGGSGLSAIGGTLRMGELRPGVAPPHHALKLELYAAKNYYNNGNHTDCFHWPATDCDGYWNQSGSSLKYGGTNPAVGPGALLALAPSVSIASLGLTTQPAKDIAWTLQNYGAYLVDDTAWSAVSLCIEEGPSGSFATQFQSDWSFSFGTGGTSSPFAKDMEAIYAALSAVTNNTASTIGGGGTPLQPLALPLPPMTPADN